MILTLLKIFRRNNMKKQLLIAAVAASMTSVAMADISISGAAQMNINSVSGADTTYSTDIDLKIVGKAGDTSATVDLEFLTTSEGTVTTATDTSATAGSLTNFVKNAYVSTTVGGANIKVGNWYGSDSLLGNGSNDDASQISVDYTMSGVKVQYEDGTGAAGDSVTVSGTVGGVSVSHEMFDTKTDTKFSTTVAGVSATYRSIDDDTNAKDATSFEVSTEVSGVTLTYVDVDANEAGSVGVTSDAFFGAQTGITTASGVSASTSIGGNKVTFKAYDINNTDTNKLIVSRPMAGGTFEATFVDTDGSNSSVDLELKVAF
jgi:hypothetical protein